jgi:hypothetical protein
MTNSPLGVGLLIDLDGVSVAKDEQTYLRPLPRVSQLRYRQIFHELVAIWVILGASHLTSGMPNQVLGLVAQDSANHT